MKGKEHFLNSEKDTVCLFLSINNSANISFFKFFKIVGLYRSTYVQKIVILEI